MTDEPPSEAFDRYLKEVEQDPEHRRRKSRIARIRAPRPRVFTPSRLAPWGIPLVVVLAGLAWVMGWTGR